MVTNFSQQQSTNQSFGHGSRSASNNMEQTTKPFFRRKKTCPLSFKNSPVVNYKNPKLLLKFLSENGRILPSRITAVCAKKQRELKEAIKVARILALLPFCQA